MGSPSFQIATQVRPPEPPNLLQQLLQVQQFKGLQQGQQMRAQQIQGAQQENQMRQQQIADSHAITKAWQSWDGKNPDDLIKGVLQNGGSGNAAGQLHKTLFDMQQQKLQLGEGQFQLQQKQTDRMLGRIDAAKGVPDDQLAGHVQSAIQESLQAGDLDPQHAQIPYQILQANANNPAALRNALNLFEKSYQLESTQFERANQERKTQAEETQAGARQLQAQTGSQRLQAEMPGGPLYSQPGAVTPKEIYTQNREDARQARSIAAQDARKSESATTDEKRRSDLAQNLNENLDNLEEIVKRQPDLFGPAAGRLTKAREWLGSNDPDIGALQTIEHQLGMVQQSTHGMRSAFGVQSAANSIVNNLHNSPQALLGSINAARKSSATFLGNANPGTAGTGNVSALPRGSGKLIDRATAQQFCKAAGNDPNKARQLAIQSGWKVQ